jgi:multidrug efflux pump subunit AcrA (membrane-fusion protein)/peptidoglycan hydrolase-like protein with peptidoglycan-binding domain
MNDDGLHAVDRPVDKHGGLSMSEGNRSELSLPLRTPVGPVSYAAGRRIRLLYMLLLIVAAAAGGAWFAGTYITSPAEMAARVAPPPPSPILVPVEERVLSADVVTRGTARYGLPQPVSLAPSPLKVGSGVITTLPLRNTQLREGDVVLTASGRPVFILQGRLPGYRDLAPELAGEDVRQLKQALARLGFASGDTDTPFDQQTSEAVAAWYKSRGWEPFGTTREQLAALRSLEREWADATKAKATAVASVETARVAVDAARAVAAHAIKSAAMENAAREAAQRRPPADSQNTGSGNVGSLTVENERVKARLANTAADAELAAQIAAEALIALDPRQTETARQAANARLEIARAAQERTKLEGEMAVQAAEREAALNARRTEVGRAAELSARSEGNRSVRAAIDAQNLAQLDVKIATQRTDQLAADLAAAKRKLGVQVPVDEVIFVPSLPVRVEEITASIGHPASGTLLTVTDNQLSVDAALPLESAPLVKAGMPVTIDEQALAIKATGVVETVAATPGTHGVDGFHIYLGVRVENTPVPLAGFSVRLTIPTHSTAGPVIAVPVSALSLATDGSSRIQVKEKDALEYRAVRPGLSAKGFVQVTPLAGQLLPGEQVVVGYSNPANRDVQ